MSAQAPGQPGLQSGPQPDAPPRAADAPLLVVDLDGTLIRSDMLFDCFWSAFSRDWRAPFRAASGLLRGRAALKARLAELGAPDPTTLPYTPEVIEEITAWRAAGGRTALVTAADQSLANAVANHLDLFDEAHGSDGTTNLKGPAKAAFLDAQFGRGTYTYIGDSEADLAVWEHAGGAMSVGLKPALFARLAALQPQARALTAYQPRLGPALRAMRPHQWAKNLLVFFPLLAAHLFTLGALAEAVFAFVAFSLVASSVYLLNDLLDIGSDRAHPRKRARPLASGALPVPMGMAMVPLLLLAGIGVALVLPALFMLVLAAYYLLTISYSLWLKRKPIVDICTLAALYSLRVAAGGAATGIELSIWLLAFSGFLFLSLAAVKRQAELVDLAQRGTEATPGRGYRTTDLPVVTQMATASGFVAALVMMVYLTEPETLTLYSQPTLLLGICIILIYWIGRMILMAQRGLMDDDPTVFAARDRASRIAFVLIAALFVAASVL